MALGLLVLAADSARADKVPTTRVPSALPGTGSRPNIIVPYTTDGYSTIMINHGVAPRIYSSPIVNDPSNPQARPVYNLPFYGGSQSFGDASNGAVSRPKR
jgi:hypothetical protein